MRSILFASILLSSTTSAAADPIGGWPSPLTISAGQPPAPPVADGVPVRVVEVMEPPPPGGQRHWFALNFALGQPSVARVGVKVLDRDNNSLWAEAYAGSALFDVMYGFGVRLQHTAWTLGNGDAFFISPGLGVHILPNWRVRESRRGSFGGWYGGAEENYSSLYYLAADADFSWLHDFSPRFGFELGMKLGLTGRLGGTVGRGFPSGVMFGRHIYPIVAFYSGFRF